MCRLHLSKPYLQCIAVVTDYQGIVGKHSAKQSALRPVCLGNTALKRKPLERPADSPFPSDAGVSVQLAGGQCGGNNVLAAPGRTASVPPDGRKVKPF